MARLDVRVKQPLLSADVNLRTNLQPPGGRRPGTPGTPHQNLVDSAPLQPAGGGWVTVTTVVDGDTVQLTVQNSGPPVPP